MARHQRSPESFPGSNRSLKPRRSPPDLSLKPNGSRAHILAEHLVGCAAEVCRVTCSGRPVQNHSTELPEPFKTRKLVRAFVVAALRSEDGRFPLPCCLANAANYPSLESRKSRQDAR